MRDHDASAFSEELETGIAAIDRDHRELMVLIQSMLDASDLASGGGDLVAALEAFSRHVTEHFKREETAMRRRKFPELALHLEQHDIMRGYVEELRQTLQKHGHVAEILELAVPLVANALLMHIEVYDRQFADFLRA